MPRSHGAVILGENAFAQNYLDYVRATANGNFSTQRTALVALYRVKGRIPKASRHGCSADELWLLVCAHDVRFGATGATS